MTEREQFEAAVLDAVSGVVSAALPSVAHWGFRLGSVDISRTGDNGSYQSEVRVYVYRNEQICDALEVRIWRDDRPLVTVDELTVWFRDQIAALGVSAS